MATPRSKEKILRCAREMFYHIGYQATSVEMIIDHSGVARSNFYYHFKSKEQVAVAVLDMQFDEYNDWIASSLRNSELSPFERLERFCGQLCLAQQEMQRLAGCPFGNFAVTFPNAEEFKMSVKPGMEETPERRREREQSERFRQHISELFNSLESALEACLEEGAACGDFRDDIPAGELAAFLLASVEGLLILTKTHGDLTQLTCGLSIAQRLVRAR